jgi:peptide deformylase
MSEVIKFDTVSAVKNEGYIKIETYFLVDESDDILRERVEEFDFDNPPVNPNEFASSLVETCREHNGFGLSANQCGFKHRVFVMGSGEEYVAFFNPRIVASSEKESLLTEGCLSFPALALKILRPEKIEVEYQDFNGNNHTGIFEGLTAHVFQHELDHLNGICYTDRAKPMALKMGLKKRGKFNKLLKRYNMAKKVMETIGE